MWYCYILKDNTNKTYNGSTNNMARRLRQHNGEIKGGAKATKNYNNWEVYFLMTGFVDHKNCLQCEWRIKHPTNKRRPKEYCGFDGRIKGVNSILNLERWTSNSIIDNSAIKYKIWVVKEYAHLLTGYGDNVEVVAVDMIDPGKIDIKNASQVYL